MEHSVTTQNKIYMSEATMKKLIVEGQITDDQDRPNKGFDTYGTKKGNVLYQGKPFELTWSYLLKGANVELKLIT